VLPQGAPTSPGISNIIAFKLDLRLRKLADSIGLVYTRYADDLIFSGSIQTKLPIILIKRIIREEGFLVNNGKTVIQREGQRQIVTGLTTSNGIHVQKHTRKIFGDIFIIQKNTVPMTIW